MNAQLRRAAKACLFSTMTGLFLAPDGFVLADAPGRIRHADAEESTVAEPSPLATLGEARPIPAPAETPNAAHKMIGAPKAKAKAKTKTTAKRPATTSATTTAKAKPTTQTTASAAAATRETESIEQTGALLGRSYGAQRPAAPTAPAAQPATTPATPQASSTMSPVERELEELYRKNGRQMPEMNMQELQVPQAEAMPTQMPAQTPSQIPSQMPAGRAGNQHGATAGYQPGTRPSKPNFFERVFGFGRSRSKTAPRTSAQQPPRNGGPAGPSGPSSYGPYVPNSARQTPPTTPFRPTPTPVVAQPTPQPQVTAPLQRPQPTTMREPTPLGPAGAPIPQYQEPSTRSGRGLTGGDGQSLLDESNDGGDSDSLDLSQDDGAPKSRSAPQILPKQTANGSTESPYTGLRITPNESEDSIARSEELDKGFEDELALDKPAAPAAAPKSAATKPAPSTAESSLKHPLAGAKAAPAAPAVRKPAPRTDDDELMELDDDEDDDDDEDEDTTAKPSKAPAVEPKAIPREEKPVYRRQTAGGQPAATSAASIAAGSAGSLAGSDVDKLSASAAQKGFKGFCPVILKDERRLVEARSQFKSEYRGRTYTFSSIEAKQTFDESPQKYAPARDGADVVRLAGGEEGVEGSLEHAAWYRGKLYLFSSDESRREFVDAPARFNVKE